MKLSQNFRNRDGYSIFDSYKTEEELKRLIVDNMAGMPRMSLMVNMSQNIFDELSDYLKEIRFDIDRQTLVNDMFKIMTGASRNDDISSNVDIYVPYIVFGLLNFWQFPFGEFEISEDETTIQSLYDVSLNEKQNKILSILEYELKDKNMFMKITS